MLSSQNAQTITIHLQYNSFNHKQVQTSAAPALNQTPFVTYPLTITAMT